MNRYIFPIFDRPKIFLEDGRRVRLSGIGVTMCRFLYPEIDGGNLRGTLIKFSPNLLLAEIRWNDTRFSPQSLINVEWITNE